MQDGLLPLFPLQMVLLPRCPLPLHIFEDRYKEMIGEAVRSRSEFGVVQAGEKGIINTGCTATVERVLRQYPDGKMDILTLGRRRFEILMLNDEKPYLRGAVQFFDDEDDELVSGDLRARVVDTYRELQQVEDDLADPDMEDPQLSFQLGSGLSDLEFKQSLLSTKSEAERIRMLADFLPNFLTRQRQVAHVKSVVPRNGHSKWPLNL